ncbi:hypothetical protein ABVB69_00275 [Streptomyces sp. NPDC000349]|uniref:hypothetical protein n=1 Tax=unclassified Streptomyces TaxID=2593676 RepID=UPI00277F5B5D|nr:hypothetical protein [Streptomyces sp. DSM 40167]MDQ0404119.1 hypothetical protein [Streptomyces sp. DSM 40167]
MTAPASGGSGPGWFGSGPGEGAPRQGSAGNGGPEILGSRIGREYQGPDPFGRQPRITWGNTDAAAPVAPVAPTTAVPPTAPTAPATQVAPAAPPPPVPLLRDPWQETPDEVADGDAPDAPHTHDPHEVTVQLDAVLLGDGVLHRADGGHRGKGRETSDGPVFVDSSGRRSRLYRRLGILVGVACAIYAVVIVSTLMSGNSNAPWLPVPGQEEGKPAGQVDTTPLPSRSGPPAATGTGAPRTGPADGTGVTGTPGGGVPAPGTTAGTAPQPGTTAGSGVTETGTDKKPGGGATTDPDPTATTQAPPPVTTGPSASTGDGDTTVDPTAPTGGATTGSDPGEGGADANGSRDTTPLAGAADAPVAGRGTTSTSTPLSPETTL